MRAEGAFMVRDALVSMYARAMTLQIRACCPVELHGRACTEGTSLMLVPCMR